MTERHAVLAVLKAGAAVILPAPPIPPVGGPPDQAAPVPAWHWRHRDKISLIACAFRRSSFNSASTTRARAIRRGRRSRSCLVGGSQCARASARAFQLQ